MIIRHVWGWEAVHCDKHWKDAVEVRQFVLAHGTWFQLLAKGLWCGKEGAAERELIPHAVATVLKLLPAAPKEGT